VLTLSLAFCQVAIWFSLYYNNYWLVVPLALLTSHIMHGNLIGFHEASHGMLRKNRLLNELDGVLIGIISLTSFSLYRAAHQTHHAHLSTARDEEFWPFVEPSTPRWFRVLAAVLELSFGLFVRKGTPIRSRKVRRRIWAELILIASIWVTVVSLVAWTGTWKYFFWMYLIPGFIAGNLQAWRKYIEHVGLTGATIRSATRSIVADTLMGRVVSFTLLHEPFHGVHHQKAGLGHAELPFYRADLQPVHEDDHPPFPSYRHALIHLLGTLKDPRVGAQWRTDAATASRRA
jgi:fatty acid desaturase